MNKKNRILPIFIALLLMFGTQLAFASATQEDSGNEPKNGTTVAGETKAPVKETTAKDKNGEKDVKDETKPEKETKTETKAKVSPAFNKSEKIGNVHITVKAAEGVLPEGAKLKVTKADTADQKKIDKAIDRARDDSAKVAVSYSYDIKILDKDGKEIQPAKDKKVEVSFKLNEADNTNLETSVYHLKEAKDGFKAEELKTETDKESVKVETGSFSYYTVEFTYDGLQYVMKGDSSVALADILKKIGLEGTVSDVKVSNDKLFSAEKKDGKWIVTAHKAFTSKEWMKVTIGGVEYEIVVTDTVPGNVVTVDVTMYGGEVKDADFTITTGAVLGPNNPGKTATIRNCTVTNKADNNRKGGVSDCTGSAFIAQKENNLLFDNVTINSGTKSLVLNIWGNASAELKNSTLDGSDVKWGDVPFILNGAYPNGDKGTLNVSGESTIKNTKGAIAGGSGGSIINVNSGTLTLKDSEIALKNNNRFVVKSGATLILDETTLDVTNCAGEPAITVEEGGKLIIRNGSSIKATAAKDFNKGIIVSSGTVEIVDSEISDITKNGGDSSIVEIKKGDLTISGSTFKNNNTPNCKGGLILANNAGTVSIEDSTFKGNTSGNAPIYVGSSEALNITGESTFSENRTKINDTGTKGGAIWAYNTPVTIGDDVTFEKNIAHLGGAIYLQDCKGSKIGKATFKENGTKFPDDTWTNAIMTCDGGAIYMAGGSAEFNGTTFQENVAAFSGYVSSSLKTAGSGGGIYMYGANAGFHGVKFKNNTALLHGGGLTVAHGSNATIRDLNGDPTEFTDNLVEFGTDQAGGGMFVNFAYANMADTAIYNNAADDAGGGISTCTRGAAQARVMNGAAIFDNKILAGDHEHGEGFFPPVDDVKSYKDIFFQTIDHKNADTGELLPGLDFPPFPYELYERMFNEGLHNWKAKPITTQNEEGVNLNSFVAQSNPNNKNVSKAKVIFTGNQAWRNPLWEGTVSGGAIASNGLIEIGTETEIKIVKLWNDHWTKTARPTKKEFVDKVTILANGKEVSKDDLIIDVITKNVQDYVLRNNIVDADDEPIDFGDKEPWLIIVSGLPKSTKTGEPIEYTIDEDAPRYYQLINNEGDMKTFFEMENKAEFVNIPVEKKWNDNNDALGLRPASIKVRLFEDGKEVDSATLTADKDWKYTFRSKPKQNNGKDIKYTIKEDPVKDYEAVVDGFEVTNSCTATQPDNEEKEGKKGSGTKTGDRMLLPLVVAILLISALALAGIAYRNRKKA